jgi:hypothetical protein
MPSTAVSALRYIIYIKRPIGLFSFIIGYSIVNLALFQAPAWRYALSVTDTSNLSGWITLLSFEILQIFLFFFLLAGEANSPDTYTIQYPRRFFLKPKQDQ